MSIELGARIKEIRKSKGLTQEELGRLIGKTTSSVGMYETGVREPGGHMEYVKLAEILECSLDYLMGNNNKKDESSIIAFTNYIQRDIDKYNNKIQECRKDIDQKLDSWGSDSKACIYSLIEDIDRLHSKVEALKQVISNYGSGR